MIIVLVLICVMNFRYIDTFSETVDENMPIRRAIKNSKLPQKPIVTESTMLPSLFCLLRSCGVTGLTRLPFSQQPRPASSLRLEHCFLSMSYRLRR